MFAIAPVAFATDRQRNILLGTIVTVGAYLSITAILEKLKAYGLVWPSYIADPGVGTHFGRARGPFVEAAANGLALYACAAAAATAFVLWRRPWPRAAAGAVVVLVPVAVLLTETRGVWVAATAATLVALEQQGNCGGSSCRRLPLARSPFWPRSRSSRVCHRA